MSQPKFFIEEIDKQNELQQELAQAEQELHTIRDFIRFCVTQLRQYEVVVAQGTTDEFAEASAIVLHSLALTWSADEQILDCRLTSNEKMAVLTLLEERITTRKPLSYLINLAYFCDLPFYVDERVLIPRSPIAELIKQQFVPYFVNDDIAQSVIDDDNEDFYHHGLLEMHLPQPERILDLCTGSGCIAIALARFFPNAMVDASDIDKDALEVAEVNIEHNDVEPQVTLLASNLFNNIDPENKYDLIVTNPPYVDSAIMAELPPEFMFEPEHALSAGQDGLDLVHHILHDAPNYLTEDGLLVCEVGESQWALEQSYPKIHFNWLEFAHGGEGIFAITGEELLQHKKLFAKRIEELKS